MLSPFHNSVRSSPLYTGYLILNTVAPIEKEEFREMWFNFVAPSTEGRDTTFEFGWETFLSDQSIPPQYLRKVRALGTARPESSTSSPA